MLWSKRISSLPGRVWSSPLQQPPSTAFHLTLEKAVMERMVRNQETFTVLRTLIGATPNVRLTLTAASKGLRPHVVQAFASHRKSHSCNGMLALTLCIYN